MSVYEETLRKEQLYLNQTIAAINKAIIFETNELLAGRRKQLLTARRELWEDTNPSSTDFDRLIESNQYLEAINNDTIGYLNTTKRIDNYKRFLSSPYFGRVDYTEDGYTDREKLYIGYCSITDPETREIYVYDWRAPVSSLFYSNQPTRAAYSSPVGQIWGTIHLKRQYKIVNSSIKYFFDSTIHITDEVLQEVLSHSSSSKMRTIVETIQQEQDLIIRDTYSDVLLVQGSAGSGKTSIALHRIAFLLYEGLNSKLQSDNVLILSPNNLFSNYIYSVLPELGEENVTQLTFDEIAADLLVDKINLEKRYAQIERMLNTDPNAQLRQAGSQFKGSGEFLTILSRLLKYYAHKAIPFQDLYFDGKVIFKREILKSRFLHNETGIPMAKQLLKLEKTIWDKVHPLRKKRLQKLMAIVQKSEGHELEIKTFSRYLSIIETRQFMRKLQMFTRVDYLEIYKLLFSQKGLLHSLSYGLNLPVEFDQIITETNHYLNDNKAFYEDCAPLIYLKTVVEGNSTFSHIRHAVIDEAQDYAPLQYEVFKHLFHNGRFTILGDVNQSLEDISSQKLYAEIASIMRKPETVTLTLNTGYRSTLEINTFNKQILGKAEHIVFFERHGESPKIINTRNSQIKAKAIIQDIEHFVAQGLSVAVICKTMSEAEKACAELKDISEIRLIGPHEEEIGNWPLIIPVYLAKGLEFDVVIIYNADKKTYSTEADRRILYVACTRAMHFLRIYYAGEISPLFP